MTPRIKMKAFDKLTKRRRLRKKTWRTDRADQTMVDARGMRAYLELAKPLPFEATYASMRLPSPSGSAGDFGAQAQQIRIELSSLQDELRKLEKQDYLGVGNDRQKLRDAISDLKARAEKRDEQELLYNGTPKTKLVEAIRKLGQHMDRLPSSADMMKSTFTKTDAVLLLTETLGASLQQINEAVYDVHHETGKRKDAPQRGSGDDTPTQPLPPTNTFRSYPSQPMYVILPGGEPYRIAGVPVGPTRVPQARAPSPVTAPPGPSFAPEGFQFTFP